MNVDLLYACVLKCSMGLINYSCSATAFRFQCACSRHKKKTLTDNIRAYLLVHSRVCIFSKAVVYYTVNKKQQKAFEF